MGKQLAGKYPVDTSGSFGKSLDLFVTAMCLWLVGCLLAWSDGCFVDYLIMTQVLVNSGFCHVPCSRSLLYIDNII